MMLYDAIYLSPHLDDVALSCGGQIYDLVTAGGRVLVVTIMSGDPPDESFSDLAQALHQRWELATGVVARRRQEDVAACAVLGADYVHWSFLDCIYRQHGQTGDFLYTTNADLFGVVHRAETAVMEHLVAEMRTLPSGKRIFAPLAVGNHVDHQLVRRAAEECFGADLFYYEDYPYVRLPGALALVVPADKAGWRAEVIPVSEAGVQARIMAISTFTSQVGSFFNNRTDLEAQIHAQITAVGGERIWRHWSNA